MTKRACIALVDAAHARIFTYSQLPDEDPKLVEIRDLVNPGRSARGYFTDKPARAPGNNHSTKDDHRGDHLDELEARFARDIVDEVARIVREQAFAHLIFVASPKMLAKLRGLTQALSREVVIDELTQDLSWMTVPQVHDHLAAHDLVAPRARRL